MKVRNKTDHAREIASNEFSATVDAGAVADVPDEVGRSLVRQPDVWEASNKATTAVSKEIK